jgi:EmrB/QacA subfamily drug resistance transporter
MELTTARRWLGLFAVLAAMIMNILDSTLVNVAGPSIRADLGGTYAQLQWLAAAYTLVLAAGVLTGGRLGDLFGRRRMLLTGAVGFVVASLACALAFSPGVLIGARVAQGACAALMIPQGFGLIRDLFPPDRIGRAFAALGPVIGLSTVLGPIVAGTLIHLDLFGSGWRAAFAINLPLGLFALLAGWRALPGRPTAGRPRRLDLPGALLAGAGMLLLIYPLVQGRERGWPGWCFGMLAASVPVLGLFVVYQLRQRRTGGTPLVELGVFARRSYACGVLFVLVFFGAVVGFGLTTGLFLQLGLGYGPMRAALVTAPGAVGAFLGSGFSAATMARLGRRILHLGLAIMAVGLVGVYLVLANASQPAGAVGWYLAGPLLVNGLGMGMIFVPVFDIIVGGIADHEVGSASGMLESLQQLGASLGVAVLGTVFFAGAGHGFPVSARHVSLITLGLLALAFALVFLLPRRTRRPAAPVPPADGRPDYPVPAVAGAAPETGASQSMR